MPCTPHYYWVFGFSVIILYGHSCASLLLANGVSLKQIQDWLGHSDFAITANIYGHLDFSSKQVAAEKMAWIGDTPLMQQGKADNCNIGGSVSDNKAETERNNDTESSMQSLPEFINSLFAKGISPKVIQGWLTKTDFTVSLNFGDCFNEFVGA